MDPNPTDRGITMAAPAKINLALHVTGQRADGYHLLDSLVAFASVGDVLHVKRTDTRARADHHLTISGPFSGGLSGNSDNLVLKAARAMGDGLPTLDLHLEKNLPIASGIGGGSTDAAATLFAISTLLDKALPDDSALLALGADVPVCMARRSVRMQGIGEIISPVPMLPPLYLVLANPGIGVSTPAIFKALHEKCHSPLSAFPAEGWSSTSVFAEWLGCNRNDLEPAARAIAPEIDVCLDALATLDNTLLARMSGSGATCFALFSSLSEAERAAGILQTRWRGWWIKSASLL